MESMLRNKKTIMFFLLPALLLYTFIVFIPIISSLCLSFYDWGIGGVEKWVGFKNYIHLFSNDDVFIKSIGNTIEITFLSLVIQMPISILFAVALSNKKLKGRRFFRNVYFTPNIISAVAIGLLWTFVYNYDFGLLNNVLRALGLGEMAKPWLAMESTALIAIVAVVSWQYIGYHMVLFLCGIENISESIYDAAKIDGANGRQLFFNITLPLLKPILKIDAVLITTSSLKIFDIVYIMTSGGPNHATEVMASHMYVRSFRGMQFGYGSAIAVILVLLCLVATLFYNIIFRNKEEV